MTITVASPTGAGSAPTVVTNAITIHPGAAQTVAQYVAAFPSATTAVGVVNFSFSAAGAGIFLASSATPLAGGIAASTGTVTAYSNAKDSGQADPTSGNTWAIATNSNIIGSDYTVSYPFAGPPTNGSLSPSKPGPSGGPAQPTSNLPTVLTPSSPYQSAVWNLDGYYPSIYVFVAPNVVAGSYRVNLNSMYQPGSGQVTNEWSNGAVPIFEGGVNFQVFNLSGAAASTPLKRSSPSRWLTPRPTRQLAPSTLTTTAANGDALFSVGLMKNSNAIQVGTTGEAGTNSPLALTAVAPLNYGPAQFAKQNFGGAVYTGTITGGANNAFAGLHVHCDWLRSGLRRQQQRHLPLHGIFRNYADV